MVLTEGWGEQNKTRLVLKESTDRKVGPLQPAKCQAPMAVQEGRVPREILVWTGVRVETASLR